METQTENNTVLVTKAVEQSTDFRIFLQNELVKRCNKNPRYSLRAFARTLGIHHSSLSQMLRGKRAISPKMKDRLGKALGLSPMEISKLKVPEIKRGAPGKGQEDYELLAQDAFLVIADWYHFAILELTLVSGFKSDHKWIARVLGISPNEVNVAVERLLRLNLIYIDSEGNWKLTGEGHHTTIGRDFSSVALRKVQKEFLNKAQLALDEVPFSERDQSGMTVAINTKRIPEAKKMIKEFRRKLTSFLEKDKDRNEVYQINLSFFPLSDVQNQLEEDYRDDKENKLWFGEIQ